MPSKLLAVVSNLAHQFREVMMTLRDVEDPDG